MPVRGSRESLTLIELHGRAIQVHIGVIGAGSWGTTLANLLAGKGFTVTLWAYEAELVSSMAAHSENSLYLPGIPLSRNIIPTGSLEEAAGNKDLLFLVTPSHAIRQTVQKIAAHLPARTMMVSASKGIENRSLLTMSAVIRDELGLRDGQRLAVLSGPTFALEVSRKIPSAVTLASENQPLAREIQQILSTPFFRVYTNTDVTGVELGGALKNVIAIAAGISDGLLFGYNTRAALITRGLAEISRLALKMGADRHTLSGLSGLGDLVLTCTGELSRNRTVGIRLGRGEALEDITRDMRTVAEGIRTAESAHDLSIKMGIPMPITEQVFTIIRGRTNPKDAVMELMTRDLKDE
jgi:glycerol-3-phosphate dehydrogenase (NAD(P)+)